MKAGLLALLLVSVLPGAAPVLVELFTSEGCSDCPPADALLERLDRSQPVPGAEVIVLSEHVDYWNRQGWVDPFSQAIYTARQQAYAFHFGGADVYTPQMVVDGDEAFVGSDWQRAQAAIGSAARREKPPMRLAMAPPSGSRLTLEITAGPLGRARSAEVYVALAENAASSQVRRGENAGRRLTHVAVVRQLVKAGQWKRGEAFEKSIPLEVPDPGQRRVVVFAQEGGSGRVVAAGRVK